MTVVNEEDLERYSSSLLDISSKVLEKLRREKQAFDGFKDDADTIWEIMSLRNVQDVIDALANSTKRHSFFRGKDQMVMVVNSMKASDIDLEDVANVMYTGREFDPNDYDPEDVKRIIRNPTPKKEEVVQILEQDREILQLFVKMFISNHIFFLFSVAVALEEGDSKDVQKLVDELLSSYRSQTAGLISAMSHRN
jgi:hypothetical protein